MAVNKVKKKNSSVKVSMGVVYINAGFNNTIVSVCDLVGNVLCWSSSGKMKFKSSQKSTPYAAQICSEDAAKIAIDKYSLKTVFVVLNGPGAGREAAIRGLGTAGLIITSITDITPIVHNGCRPPNRRRI
jgi:small subunit ribosomal protein S11